MPTWRPNPPGTAAATADPDGLLVAYFSAEFGLTECLSVFAGGLGVLAGDHLKSASDLGVPLVGVGLTVPAGILPAIPECRRLAAGILRG